MPNRFALHAMLGSGPSYKAALMLSLVGEPRDYVHVNLRAGEQKTPDYLAKNRYGQVPVLEDRELGLFICQSSVILEHVAERTGKMLGASTAERLRSREWMFWEADRLMKGIFRPRSVNRGFMKLSEDTTAHYKAEGAAGLELVNAHLAGRDFLVGSAPTFADVDLYGVIFFAGEAGHDLTALTHLHAWKARIESLPGYGLPGEVQDAPPAA